MATIRCDAHGVSHEAFVCKHLVYGKYLGFFCDLDDHGNPFPDAWCNGCELVRIEHNGWCDATEEIIEIAAQPCNKCNPAAPKSSFPAPESRPNFAFEPPFQTRIPA